MSIIFCFRNFQYADPVADLLDKWGVFRARLFRESCVFHRGNYVKVGTSLCNSKYLFYCSEICLEYITEMCPLLPFFLKTEK